MCLAEVTRRAFCSCHSLDCSGRKCSVAFIRRSDFSQRKGRRIITYAYPPITWGDSKTQQVGRSDISHTQNKCGSEPARECGLAVTAKVSGIPSSRAGSLPQGTTVNQLLWEPIRQAISNAWRIAPTFALPCPAMSNAVPWAGVVIGIGRPPCTVTPRENPISLIAIWP